MESQLIIFLAVASLAQGTFVPTLKVDYGLPANEVADLNTIITNQKTTDDVSRNGFKAWFDLFFDPEDIGDDYQSEVDSEDIIKLIYDSVALVVGESCSALEDARNASYEDWNNAATETNTALFTLVRFGSYDKNEGAIETSRAAAAASHMNTVNTFYDAISTCLATTDEKVQPVIDEVRSASLLAVTQFNNAIFNAMNVRAAVTSFPCSNTSIVTTTKDLEAKALVGIQADIEYKYSLLKALYLYIKFNQAGNLEELYANQLALTVSFRGYVEGNLVLFNTLVRHMKEIQFGFQDDGVLGFSQDDSDLRKVIAAFDAGDRAIILKSFLALHPESNATIQANYQTIYGFNVEGDTAFYNAVGISTTSKNLTANLEQIEIQRNAAVGPAPEYTGIFFGMIRGDLTFDATTEAQLVALQNLTIIGAQQSTSKFLDGVIILAKAFNAGEVSETAYTDFQKLLDEIYDALADFCQGISAGAIVALKVKYNSS